MKDLIAETKSLAKAYNVDFKECASGHIQLRAHGNLVNYWPNSKNKTMHSPTLDRHEKHVLPWDAIKLCLSDAKPGMRPMKKRDVPKNKANFSLEPARTNPSRLKHFYDGTEPPWEGEGFEFIKPSDELRHQARSLESKAVMLRSEADELDEAA